MTLWNPELAKLALEAPTVETLRLPGWECSPFDIQSRGIVWLHSTPRAFLADVTGLGKTIHGIGLVALLMATGELGSGGGKAVFCVLAGLVDQWCEEFSRFLPGAVVVSNQKMDRAERQALYRYPWDVLVTSYDLMRRDAGVLSGLAPQLVFFDESSTFRNSETVTASGARKLVANASRVVCASATPMENSLEDIFSQLEVLGLAGRPDSLFGTAEQFAARYLVQQAETIFVRGGRQHTRQRTVGYRNLEDLTSKLAPFWLRRTEGSDDMPEVIPEDQWVPMTERQAEVYTGLRDGFLDGEEVDLAAKTMRLLQATSGLANLGMEDESGKLNWLMESLGTRYAGEKVVVFSRWLPTVAAFGRRLQAAGIGYSVISGAADGYERDQARRRFWEDPACRVIIITTAGEKGLNLQVAKYVVTIDLMWNPARVEQIVGRVKRSGSRHSHVFLHRLMAPGTVEAGVLKVLRYKQALADHINGDESDLFERLTNDELRTVIRG